MITTIPQNHVRVITRFGKPVRVQKSGLAFRLPLLEQPARVDDWPFAQKNGRLVELSEQINAYDGRECITRDNAQVLVNVVLSWRIVAPVKAIYEVDNLFNSLEQAVLNMVRSEIGSQELDETLTNRTLLNERMAGGLSDTLRKWGLQLIRVEIQEIKTDGKTSDAMLQQLEAERKSRAIVSEAEGRSRETRMIAEAERDAAIAAAEGKAKSIALLAAAEAEYLTTLAGSVGSEQASRLLFAQKVVDGLDQITRNEAHKVFLPSGPQGVLDLMGNPPGPK